MMKNFRKLLAFTLVLAITLCACLPLSLAETSPLEAADKLLGKITITFEKSSYEAGKPITASYTISGGSGTYKSMDYCVYITNNGITGYFTGDQLTKTTGTIEFTPKFGQEAVVEISVTDSEGRYFSKQSDPITLTGGTDPNPITAKLTVDKTTCEVGTTITASYEVTGGSGEYWIAYDCYSIVNGSYTHIASDELDAAKGTFTFTPKKGQEAYVNLYGNDMEDRRIDAQVGPITLTGDTGEASGDSVVVKITFSKNSYPLGSTITANYTISGGSGSYSNMRYRCYTWDGDDIITCAEGDLAAASGSIQFTPKYGQYGFVQVSGQDSNGNEFRTDEFFMLTDKSVKKLKISKVTATSKKKIKVEWKKLSKKEIKKAKYIQVVVSTDKDFSTTAAYQEVSPKKSSVTIKNLQKNTKYYVRIRVVGENDEGVTVYGPWSSVKKVKTKKK